MATGLAEQRKWEAGCPTGVWAGSDKDRTRLRPLGPGFWDGGCQGWAGSSTDASLYCAPGTTQEQALRASANYSPTHSPEEPCRQSMGSNPEWEGWASKCQQGCLRPRSSLFHARPNSQRGHAPAPAHEEMNSFLTTELPLHSTPLSGLFWSEAAEAQTSLPGKCQQLPKVRLPPDRACTAHLLAASQTFHSSGTEVGPAKVRLT